MMAVVVGTDLGKKLMDLLGLPPDLMVSRVLIDIAVDNLVQYTVFAHEERINDPKLWELLASAGGKASIVWTANKEVHG